MFDARALIKSFLDHNLLLSLGICPDRVKTKHMLANIMRIIKPYKLPILSGVLIGTTYIPFPPWASLFCFVPLWIYTLENQDSYKRVFFGGWITGFVLTLIGFNWIALTIHDFGMMPWPLAILGLIAHCSIANLDMAIAGLAWVFLKKRFQLKSMASWGLLATLTAIFEAHFPSIFEWNYAYTFFWVKLPLFQLSELFGFQGISSLIIFINLAIFMAVKLPQFRRKLILQAVAAFIALNFFGWILKLSLPQPDASMKVGIVQANIGNLQQQATNYGSDFRRHIIDSYLELSENLVKTEGPLDYIVWPETAFPATIFDNGYGDHHLRRLQEKVAELKTPFIIGAYGYENETRRPKNAIFALDENGMVHPEHYYKTQLLAFGEYIPGVEIFPSLRQFIPASEFARGKGPKTIEFQNQKIGLQICYESLFPRFSRGVADQGAQWILNVTNDSWYGTWQEPYQHLMMTLARAVEVRRPLVRATNTGISTVVLANGDVLERSPTRSKWAKSFDVPYYSQPKQTIFQKWPWLTDTLLLLLLVVFLGSDRIGRIRKH
jgi:apolipoprotein N-acyltransferase